MKKILVLGAGRVGSAIAYDLSISHSVTIADCNQKTLDNLKKDYNLQKLLSDFSIQKDLTHLIKDYDLIISAVPGFLGFETLKTIIENKKNVVDISFFPENALELNKLAITNNVCALVDFGVAPGLGNILFGHYDTKMVINSYECYVGGLPKNKTQPFQYKAPFSPIDVIEEYTRPARLFKDGKIIIKEPLSDIEIIKFDNTEDLEAFNTDGLRSLLFTMSHVPHMKEKTLRYPGHAIKIKLLKDIGYFDEKIRNIGQLKYKPIHITADILKEQWLLQDQEEEFTVMKILLANDNQHITIDLYDEYDKKNGITSMARTTGYTCTAGANLILNNLFSKPGVFPPELIGKNLNCYEYIIKYLHNRNINLKTKINK
tara:strand:- start:4888 stop:6006 length:1119 start_codon:yes stop_codon:yes gene_type:complete